MSTRAEEVSIQAVSPLSIFDGGAAAAAGAPAAGAAGAGVTAGAGAVGAGDCASTSPTEASTSTIASAKVNRLTFFLLVSVLSQRVLITLTRPDPDRGLHRRDEDLAVADVAGLRRRRHHLRDLVHEVVGHDDLDLDLGQEVDRVLAAPIELGMALLAPEAADLGDRHADDADAGQGFLDVVELEGLDDRLDLFHALGLPGEEPRSNGHARPSDNEIELLSRTARAPLP